MSLEECRKCRESNHPGQMISFKKSVRVNPATGKPYWDLINKYGSDHIPRNGQVGAKHKGIQ